MNRTLLPPRFLTIPAVLYVFLGNVMSAQAQKHEAIFAPPTDSNIIVQPNLLLKYSLTSLIEPTPTLQVAIEHRLKGNFSLQHEIGYISSYPQINVEEYSGVRLRSEIRKYFEPLRYNATNVYMAIEVFGQYNQSDDNYWYCRDNCFYSQRFARMRQRITAGIAFEYGWMRVYKDHFLLDFVLGAGIKHARVVYDDLPKNLQALPVDDTGSSAFFRTLLSDMNNQDLGVNFIFGIKLGYVLK